MLNRSRTLVIDKSTCRLLKGGTYGAENIFSLFYKQEAPMELCQQKG